MKKTIKLLGLLFVAAMVFAGCANGSSSSSDSNPASIATDTIKFSDGNWTIDVTETQNTKYGSTSDTSKDIYKYEITITGNKAVVTKATQTKKGAETDVTNSKKYSITDVSDLSPDRLFSKAVYTNIKKYKDEEEKHFRATASKTYSQEELTMLLALAKLSGQIPDNISASDMSVICNSEANYAKK